jgi:hypothetical protein
MFAAADLRERVILSMATDLGLRISDFIKIKKNDIPPLDQEPPVMFDVMTGKEEVVAHGFLSAETVELLKVYLPTLQKKENPYLFPSNGNRPISDEWLNQLLRKLSEKAQFDLNGKNLTFHCFRKMFLSASIDSGIGLTAGKKLCGKAIAHSDDTYLTTVKLKEKFKQLKKFLTIKESTRVEGSVVEKLERAVSRLSEELEQQKVVATAVTGENLRIKKEFEKQVAELNEKVAIARLLGEEVTKIGEGVKKWQEEKDKLEAKLAGFENFQKLILEQPDEVILEFIKDVRRQIKEQRSQETA